MIVSAFIFHSIKYISVKLSVGRFTVILWNYSTFKLMLLFSSIICLVPLEKCSPASRVRNDQVLVQHHMNELNIYVVLSKLKRVWIIGHVSKDNQNNPILRFINLLSDPCWYNYAFFHIIHTVVAKLFLQTALRQDKLCSLSMLINMWAQ